MTPSLIPPLTSLRFVAAMMVVAHHYWNLEAGYAGVGFFFVLSGYVLALNYSGKVSNWTGRRDFYRKRFARIYPTHLLTFLFALPLGSPILDTLPSIPLVQSWIPLEGIYTAANGPSWSISDEAFFYALFPFLLGIRWRALMIWGALLFVAAWLWPYALDYRFLWHGMTVEPTNFLFYIFPPTRLFEFALGIALARLPGRTGLPAEVGTLLLVAASVAILPLLSGALAATWFFIPASAALIYVFARSEGPIARLLANRWLVMLGDASFMLYMIHWPLMRYLGPSWPVALLAVGASVGLHLIFEKPAQQLILKSNLFRRPSTTTVAAGPLN